MRMQALKLAAFVGQRTLHVRVEYCMRLSDTVTLAARMCSRCRCIESGHLLQVGHVPLSAYGRRTPRDRT